MGNLSDYSENGQLPELDPEVLMDPAKSSDLDTPADYFRDAESDAPGTEGYIDSKDNQQWSDGIADEENDFGLGFSEQEEESNEGLYPESQPLNLGDSANRDIESASDDLAEIQLQPDNIQYDSEP